MNTKLLLDSYINISGIYFLKKYKYRIKPKVESLEKHKIENRRNIGTDERNREQE